MLSILADRTYRHLFAAQFTLSHACWLVAYPLSGWLMTEFGAVPALLGLIVALRAWPSGDPLTLEHSHDNLAPDHPHLQGQRTHRHALVIDDLHPHWGTRF